MKHFVIKKGEKSNIFIRILALLITTALVLGALVLVVYRDRFNVDALKRWLTYRSLETSDTGEAIPFSHAGGDKLSLAYLQSGVLQASTTGTHYYSFSGECYAEEVLAMENPVLSANRKAGVVYDAGGQSLFLFKNGSEDFQLTLEGNGDLLSARVNESGWLTVTAQQSGYKGVVTVYNTNLKEVIEIRLSSTFVVDAALSPDCKTVAIITMDQTEGTFSSKLLLFPVNQTTPKAEIDLGNSVVLDLDYESHQIWVLGESQLTIVPVDSDAEPTKYSFGRSHLKGCSLNGDGFAMLLLGRYRTGSANEVLIVTPDGAVSGQMDLSGQVLSFDCAGYYCSLLTSSQLNIYTRELIPYASLTTTQSARHTALAPDGSALLANDQKAWLYIPK